MHWGRAEGAVGQVERARAVAKRDRLYKADWREHMSWRVADSLATLNNTSGGNQRSS